MPQSDTIQHPRTVEGRFQGESAGDVDGYLALSDCLVGTEALNARLVLRGYGAGCGLLYRLDDKEAVTVAETINTAVRGKPRECHSEIARKVIHDFLEARAGRDSEPITTAKAEAILKDATAAKNAAQSGYDRAQKRRTDSIWRESSDATDIREAEEESYHAHRDLIAAIRRLGVATWDWLYVADEQKFWAAMDNGSLDALATAERFEDPEYRGAVGACCGNLHDVLD